MILLCTTKYLITQLLGFQVNILLLVYNRIVYIPFIMTLVFESLCVDLIHLRTISLIDVSLPGTIYRFILSNQNLSHRLKIILDQLICLHF